MNFLADESKVRVLGRTIMKDGIRYLNYSASAIEFEFIGKRVEADIITFGDLGEDRFKAWLAVMVNDEFYKKFCLDKKEDRYLLYEGKNATKIKIKLIKLSEASFAKAGIKSIYIDSLEGPVKPKEKSRKFEFIGDSITCGYGIEGKVNEGEFTTEEENVLKSYGVKTADYFDADYNLISFSSKGVITSWVDKDVEDKPITDWLMPTVYKYTDLGISMDLKIEEPEIWDSKRYEADVVVINLGTNDASYTRDIKDRIEYFGKEYYRFINYIREHNKKASIICTMGIMGQELCPEIEKQVKKFNEDKEDNNVYFMAFDVQNRKDGIGTDYHPSAKSHEKMADKLISYLKDIKGWN